MMLAGVDISGISTNRQAYATSGPNTISFSFCYDP
jgi:hypothetical protein